MRNKYLNMQRLKMKALKAHLNKKKFTNITEDTRERHMEVEMLTSNKECEKTKSRIEFQPGVIIKLKILEPTFDMKKLKVFLYKLIIKDNL